MKKTLSFAFLFALALPLTAQNWSVGVHTGPFVFGDFVERRLRPVNTGSPEDPITLTLSASTRAGLAVDLERSFSERFAVRVEATFTRAPLFIRQSDSEGIEFDSGEMDVVTVMVPLVWRINPRGTFRFHVMGGPAYAMYEVNGPAHTPTFPVDSDLEDNEWGVAFGGGVAWWVSDRFAVEGTLTDIITTSPFDNLDDPDVPGVTIKKPHNVHTTVGVRWRF